MLGQARDGTLKPIQQLAVIGPQGRAGQAGLVHLRSGCVLAESIKFLKRVCVAAATNKELQVVDQRASRATVRAAEQGLGLGEKSAGFVLTFEVRQLVTELLQSRRRSTPQPDACGCLVALFAESRDDAVKSLWVAVLAGQPPRTKVGSREIIGRKLFHSPQPDVGLGQFGVV